MPIQYLKKIAKTHGVSVQSLETKWDRAKEIAEDSNRADDYPYITGIFNRMILESAPASSKPTKFTSTYSSNQTSLTQHGNKMKLNASNRITATDEANAQDDVFKEVEASYRVSAANLKDFQPPALIKTAERNVKEFEQHLNTIGKMVASALKKAGQPPKTYWYVFADRKLSPSADAVLRGYMNGKPAYVLVAIDLNGLDRAAKLALREAFTSALGGTVGRTKDGTGIICQVFPS